MLSSKEVSVEWNLYRIMGDLVFKQFLVDP